MQLLTSEGAIKIARWSIWVSVLFMSRAHSALQGLKISPKMKKCPPNKHIQKTAIFNFLQGGLPP